MRKLSCRLYILHESHLTLRKTQRPYAKLILANVQLYEYAPYAKLILANVQLYEYAMYAKDILSHILFA